MAKKLKNKVTKSRRVKPAAIDPTIDFEAKFGSDQIDKLRGIIIDTLATDMPRAWAEIAVNGEPYKPSYRDMKFEMEDEIRAFRDLMVEKYKNFYGNDMRKDVSWYMEQMGISIHHDLEREKRAERNRLIAENQAAQKEPMK